MNSIARLTEKERADIIQESAKRLRTSMFRSEYLRPEIRLEIGPLAQWIPNARYRIRAYVAEALPGLFEDTFCEVQAIKAERTF